MLKNRKVNIAIIFVLIGVMISDNYSEVPLWIYLTVISIYIGLQVYGSLVLSAQYFTPVLLAGQEGTKDIAITFDDGPLGRNTEKILEILNRFKVTASFFCIGHRIKANPGLLSRIYAEGHLIGNHSYWHGKTFDLQSAAAITRELKDTNAIISQTVGVQPNFFRPPYGVTNPMVAAAIKDCGYKTIGWSVRSMDTVTKDPEKLLKKVTSSLKGGDVLLFHDYCDSTVEMLPALIEYIKKNGFRIVRLDDLLNEKAYA
jgi:peptidoglycan-N-acetylglucosamine deacetylase